MFGRSVSTSPVGYTFESLMNETRESENRRLADKARKEARAVECAKFWRTNLDTLAEKHAEALSKIDYFDGDPEREAKILQRKLSFANLLLLQQSDARWSTEITDRALRLLDHDPTRFRFAAQRTG